MSMASMNDLKKQYTIYFLNCVSADRHTYPETDLSFTLII